MHRLIFPFLLIFLSFAQGNDLNAQKIKVVTLSIQDIDNKLVINYDFVKSKEKQHFKVTLQITSSSGNPITIKSLSGDIGEDIPGGPDKQIIWDYNADGIVLQDKINIEIFADLIIDESEPVKSISGGKAILLSTIVPGLGLSGLDKGKPYWLMGIAAYGTLGYSYILNKKANENYDSYLANTDKDINDELLSDSQSQNKLSKTMACTAAGIWGINMIWTAIKAKNRNKKNIGLLSNPNFNLYSVYEPFTKTSGLGIKLTF